MVNVPSQFDAALQAYLDNAGYAENNSVTQAKAFVTACRKLLMLQPKATHSREGGLETSPEEINAQMTMAIQFISANDTSTNRPGGPSTTQVDFRDFRW
jgi:hypothetical protein